MDKHYNYAIIEGYNITLFNESTVTGTILTSDFLVDVDAVIDDNCLLHLSGKKVVYDFYTSGIVYEDEWEHEPEKKLIRERRRLFGGTIRYVRGGWVRTVEREDVEYIFSGFKIKVLA
jgi:hypothetical protein